MKEPSHRLRWKLCKALGRLVDDYEFSLINREQWHWYNAMIVQDEKASRKASEVHSFATDEEFSRQIKDEDYKTNRYVKAIQKINDMNDANTNRRGKSSNDIMKDMINRRKMKLPTDLAALIDEV